VIFPKHRNHFSRTPGLDRAILWTFQVLVNVKGLLTVACPPLPFREAAPENQLGGLPGHKRILVYSELENRTWLRTLIYWHWHLAMS